MSRTVRQTPPSGGALYAAHAHDSCPPSGVNYGMAVVRQVRFLVVVAKREKCPCEMEACLISPSNSGCPIPLPLHTNTVMQTLWRLIRLLGSAGGKVNGIPVCFFLSLELVR